ncbi:MAG: DUF2671 domain-containing protein [Alphaproteobacteria bacterium]|nr:DUF2671 domain-containing protein [Alphaproteobacteria bacterium]
MHHMKENPEIEKEILTNIKYICKITPIITESLRNGCDVAQMANGDIIVSEVKTVNTHYSWDDSKERMMKSNKT